MRRELPPIKIRKNSSGPRTFWAEWKDEQGIHRSASLGPVSGPFSVTRKQAENKLLESMRPSETMKDFILRKWLPSMVAGWSPNTRRQMAWCCDRHVIPEFGERKIGSITALDVRTWIASLSGQGLATNTAKQAKRILGAVLQSAMEGGMIERNPITGIRLPSSFRKEVESEPFTMDEFAKLVAIKGEEGLALRILLFCGLREGEVAALRCEDIRGRSLMVDESSYRSRRSAGTKAKTAIEVQVPPDLAEDLALFATGKEPKDLLFAWGRDEREVCHPRTINNRLVVAAEAAGVKGFTVRRCRTTTATRLRTDVKDVQKQLRHSDSQTTLRHYRKSDEGRLADAVEEMEKEVKRMAAKQGGEK